MKKFIIPSPGRLLLKEYKEEKKKGSLILSEDKSTRMYQIINVSEDSIYNFDEIVCIKSYPTGLEIDGQVYFIISQEDVLCSIEFEDED